MSIDTSYPTSPNWFILEEPKNTKEHKPDDLEQKISEELPSMATYDQFLKAGLFEKAQHAAAAIASEYHRMIAFVDICRELSNKKHFDQALLLARTHLQGRFASRALSSICRSKVKTSQMNEALEIAELIPDELSKELILSTISRTLAEMGETQKSTSVAYTISNELSRSLTFETNSKKLVEIGRIDEALEVANRITNDYGKRRALAPIQHAIEKSGDKKKAEELLILINSLPYACID